VTRNVKHLGDEVDVGTEVDENPSDTMIAVTRSDVQSCETALQTSNSSWLQYLYTEA